MIRPLGEIWRLERIHPNGGRNGMALGDLGDDLSSNVEWRARHSRGSGAFCLPQRERKALHVADYMPSMPGPAVCTAIERVERRGAHPSRRAG
jgi:hypothetical protein